MKSNLQIVSKLLMLCLLLGQSFFLCAQTRYTGMNVGGHADWEESRVFADVMKSSRKWELLSGADSPLDANGWPTGDARINVFHGVDRFHGTYKLTFTGNGNVAAGMATNPQIINKIFNAATNTTTADVVLPVNDVNGLSLTFTGIAGGVKNVKLMRPLTPGSTQSYAVGTLFTTQYKDALAKSDMIRTMDLSHTNTSDEALWQDRIPVTNATYYFSRQSYTSSWKGGYKNMACPWEILVALANETNKDLWICVPLYADDNYVNNLANLIKNGGNGFAGLNANLKLYVEFSNELWNTAPAFQQGNQNRNLALAEVAAGGSNLNFDGETNDWYWAWRRIGKRTREISHIFKNVFGATQMMSRIRPVLCWQQGAEQETARQIFTYLENAYPTEKISDYVFGGGGSAYYAPDFNATLNSTNVWTTNTMDVNFWKNIIKKDVAWTATYGLQYLCYEGGSGFDKCNCPNDAVMQAAWAAPQHRQNLIDHQIAFDQMGGFMLGYFTIATYNAREWGFTENIYDLNTQKFNALNDIRAGTKSPLTFGNVAPGSFFPSDWAIASGWGQPSAGGSVGMNTSDYRGYAIRTNTTANYQVQLEYQNAVAGTQIELFLGSNLLGILTLTQNTTNTLTINSTNINLTANTLYGIRLKVKAGGATITKINLINPASCSTPTGITATPNINAASLAWTAVSGAGSYSLRYRVNGTTAWTTVTSTTNSRTISSLLASTTYQYQLATVCSNGVTSAFSNIATFITNATATCSTPTGITASPGVNSVALAWAATSGANSYSVQYRVNGASTWLTLSSATNNLTINTLAASTTYQYQIATVCSNGLTSAYSTITSFVTNAAPPVSSGNALITFENLAIGNLGTSSYNDPTGYTFEDFGFLTENLQILGTPSGYTSKCLENLNFQRGIRIRKTNNEAFNLVSLDYAGDQWGGLADATITAFFSNGTTATEIISSSQKVFATKTFTWTNLTKVEINYDGGSSNNFGVIDNINLTDVTQVIDFENLTVGNQTSGTYADAKGLTFSHVAAPSEIFVVNGTAQGFTSKVLQNQNWSQKIRINRTGGGNFDLKSFDYVSSQWNDAVDAKVTGTFANGTTQQVTYTTSIKTLQKLTLNWNTLTAVEIDFGWGNNGAFGGIDNVTFVKGASTSSARIGVSSVEVTEMPEKGVFDLMIYPNPTTDKLTILTTQGTINEVNVFDIRGRKVLSKSTELESISVKDLNDGLYILQVGFEGGRFLNRKFIKK